MKTQHEIKITGSGTYEEISKALKSLIKSIDAIKDIKEGNKDFRSFLELEDATLFTEIKPLN